MNPKQLYILLLIIVISILAIITLDVWPDYLKLLIILIGFIYFFFLPGFIWTYLFWVNDQIELFNRIIVSFVLSILITPLSIFISNKILIPINLIDSVFIILLINIIGIILINFHKKKYVQI